VIILLVLVMLFGATRLADLGGSLGKGVREFRKNIRDDEDEAGAAPTASTSTTTATATPVAPSNGDEVISAVRCPSCGALNVMGSKHCNQCGASITAPVS
jgi:sec-independent protein translocase protein TatA